MTFSNDKGWREEFDKKFSAWETDNESIKSFIADLLARTEKEVNEHWMYQTANEHDNKIRESERTRIEKEAYERGRSDVFKLEVTEGCCEACETPAQNNTYRCRNNDCKFCHYPRRLMKAGAKVEKSRIKTALMGMKKEQITHTPIHRATSFSEASENYEYLRRESYNATIDAALEVVDEDI